MLASPEEPAAESTFSGLFGWRDVRLGVAIGLAILGVALARNLTGERAGASQAVSVVGEGKGPAPAIGQPAPEFEVQGLDGQLLRLSDFRGKPVWINFFATWCPPCRAETPDLQAAFEDDRRRGGDLVLLGMDMGEDARLVNDYVSSLGISYSVGLDRDFAVSAEYRVRGLPTHVFIDRGGIVRDIKGGVLTPEAIRQELAKIS